MDGNWIVLHKLERRPFCTWSSVGGSNTLRSSFSVWWNCAILETTIHCWVREWTARPDASRVRFQRTYGTGSTVHFVPLYRAHLLHGFSSPHHSHSRKIPWKKRPRSGLSLGTSLVVGNMVGSFESGVWAQCIFASMFRITAWFIIITMENGRVSGLPFWTWLSATFSFPTYLNASIGTTVSVSQDYRTSRTEIVLFTSIFLVLGCCLPNGDSQTPVFRHFHITSIEIGRRCLYYVLINGGMICHDAGTGISTVSQQWKRLQKVIHHPSSEFAVQGVVGENFQECRHGDTMCTVFISSTVPHFSMDMHASPFTPPSGSNQCDSLCYFSPFIISWCTTTQTEWRMTGIKMVVNARYILLYFDS